MSQGGLPDNWEQLIAKLLKRTGLMTPEKLNVQPFPTDDKGVVTDVRSNAEIWQEKVNMSGFAGAQSNVRAGLEGVQNLLSVPPSEFGGGKKTFNSPMPAPLPPKQDQLQFAQEASQPDRNQMQSRYMNDANARSQVARQVTRDHSVSKAPAWAQKFINAGPAPRRGGPQEY